MNQNKKILVIGAGIAGPIVCYWLKKYGFNPTLIEKSKQLRTGGHAIDIRGIALGVVKKMNLYDHMHKKRTSILSTRYVDTNGQTILEERGEKSRFRMGDDLEIIRGDFVHILLQAIPDIPCYFDQEIISLSEKTQCVEVTFKDAHIKRYDLVIGADGLHSSTRRMTFSDESYQFFNLNSYISVFSTPNYLNLNGIQVLFEKDQKSININNDKDADRAFASFVFRSKEALTDIASEKKQKEYLRAVFRDFGWESNRVLECMDDSDDFYFDVMAQIKMNAWSKGRVALLGDAAYSPSPLSGQGTNLAIVGAYILAGELKSAEGNYSLAFERYNQLMRPFVEANQDLGVCLGKNFLMEGEISKEIAEQRSSLVTEKINEATNAISLPEYL